MRQVVSGKFGAVLLGFCIILSGCSGNTDGGDAQNQAQSGSTFQAGSENSGTVTLNIRDREISVGETSTFVVEVKDVNGGPVRQAPVVCDSEQGLVIVEPSTGSGLTDDFGAMSGSVGCNVAGSLQMACRLGVGGNRRVFASVICSGPIPAEYTPLTGAGGNLFGGVGDDGDDVDPDRRIEITGINGTSVSGNGFEIDVVFNPDCDGDATTTNDSEPYGSDSVTLTLRNSTNWEGRVTGAFFTVADVGGSTYTSPLITGNIDGGSLLAGADGSLTIPFTTGDTSGKTFVGSSTAIPADTGFRNVTFRVQVELANGEELTASARAGFQFANYDACS